MNRSSFLITLAAALLTASLWAWFNAPSEEPDWPKRIEGFCFSPFRADQSPLEERFPSIEQLEADLALLAGKTNAIRTYSLEHESLEQVPALARKYGMNVAVGAWINADLERNERELDALVRVAGANFANVIRVIVGNESILRGDVSVAQLTRYLDRMRATLVRPVSTAEPWDIWVRYPQLVDHVDYIAVHLLPYWEGIDVDLAVDYALNKIDYLELLYPNKPIVIAEVGWPSRGRIRAGAVASAAHEAVFLRRFLAEATERKYIYYVMEAFDQPWKRISEGDVGAYWGVYNVDRQPKFALSEPIIALPDWPVLAGISVSLAALVVAIIFRHSATLLARGRGFVAVIVFAASTVMVWIINDYFDQYLTPSAIAVGALMILSVMGVLVILLTEAHEWAEALWVSERRRALRPIVLSDQQLPMVSIHVPAYNEPPEMMIESLNALARLNYPHFEVLVIDNNTADPAIWEPVEAHCKTLGQRFRFFHVAPLSGFKAGALNYGLARTDGRAQIIAVIDSDYIVEPNWLRDLVPQFVDAKLAIVQAPQDYRDAEESIFKSYCYAEYKGFFFVGMVTRNERNAIIQHGTMTLVRRQALEEVGGWGEWCITEDAELGLRLFAKGYEALYVPDSYGRGLMPDNYSDYKKQRFRWAYGAMQIMRHHAAKLFGRTGTGLTLAQRYHFVAGWLPWIADAMNLLFNIAALGWSLAMLIAPRQIDPPLIIFSVLPLVYCTFKLAKIIYLYQSRVGARGIQTFGAALTGLSLSHTIGRATLRGLVTRSEPFFRTPKLAPGSGLLAALAAAREEMLLLVALLLAATGIVLDQGISSLDLLLWVVVLVVQSLPYLASLFTALVAGLGRQARPPLTVQTAQ